MRKKKLLFGVGLNDAETPVTVEETITLDDGTKKRRRVWTCPYYRRWQNMLERCYSKIRHKRSATYIGCSVCEEWLTFSNFKAWMESQDWEDKQLDKDILVPGNKVYSPETCTFIDQHVNTFIGENASRRGDLPIGVEWCDRRKKYRARCRCWDGSRARVGDFDAPEEAFQAWLKEKLRLARVLAASQTDPRVAKALVKKYENYQGDGRNADAS